MNFKLYQSMCAANYAVGQLMMVEFNGTHHMPQDESIKTARKYLMDALDALSSYQATLPAKEAA